MAKLYIAKNRFGTYYAKIKNKYANCEKIVCVNLPEGTQLHKDFGWYDCEYFLSCFKKANGEIELVIKVTRIVSGIANVTNPDVNPMGAQSVSAYNDYVNSSEEYPF